MGRKHSIRALRSYGNHLLAEEGAEGTARRRLRGLNPAVAIAAFALFLYSNIGLAALADSAVPGDSLSGLDRTYESIAAMVGWELDSAGERVEEASVLLARGDYHDCLELLASASGDVPELGESIKDLARALPEGDHFPVSREQLHSRRE